MAVRLDTPFAAIKDRVGTIIKDVSSVISFGIGRANEERVESDRAGSNFSLDPARSRGTTCGRTPAGLMR
jgi:hypothetical protein